MIYTRGGAIKLEVSGLDEYLKKVEAKGNNVDDAIAKALHESAKPIEDDIREWAEKHKHTGAALSGVTLTDPKRHGNEISVEVGISSAKNKRAWHIVFVEFGTPKKAADPGIRLAFLKNRAKVKRIQREVLEREGII